MKPLIASFALLIVASATRASEPTALGQLGEAGAPIAAGAAALRRSVAARSPLDARMDRISHLHDVPPYVDEKVEEWMRLFAGRDSRNLRLEIAGVENEVESQFAGGGSCQQKMDDSVAAHRRYAAMASADMTEIYETQLDTVKSVAARLAADSQADAADLVAAGGNRILALMKARGLSPSENGAAFEWERLKSCVTLRSTHETLQPDIQGLGANARRRRYVEYRSCVTPDTKSLSEALHTWGTSSIVSNTEGNWVPYQIYSCVKLEGLRRLYDGRKAD